MTVTKTLLLVGQLIDLIPEVQFRDAGLPYLMATYKIHRLKYRWLTNATNCVFLGPATIIIQALHLVVIELKAWYNLWIGTYKRFGKVVANIYWVINLLFDFTLNLPPAIHSIYMADITRCYESIPLSSVDNLPDALQFVIRLAFQQHHFDHRKEQAIWVHINSITSKVDSAKWSLSRLGSSCWIPLSQQRLLSLQWWLIQSCYIQLGDSLWQKITGILMGFSCSPL